MKNYFRKLTLLLLIMFISTNVVLVSPSVYAEDKEQSAGEERPVMVTRTTASGETVTVPIDQKKPVSEFKGEGYIIVDDFEDEDPKNNVNGEMGEWNLNPEDETVYCQWSVVPVDRPDGTKQKALRLEYDVDSKDENILQTQNGFWMKLMHLDASGYDHLQFDIKGDEKAGYPEAFKVELKTFKDKARTERIRGSALVKGITSEWQTINIPLNSMTGLLDFASPEVWKNPSISRRDLDEFVIVFEDGRVKSKTGVIYIDNIKFVKTGQAGPTAVDFPPWDREKTPVPLEGLEFAKFLIKRLKGFPSQILAKKDFPKDDREFLLEIAKDTWKFFDNVVDQQNYLPLDQVALGDKEAVGVGTWIGDYTNVTDIGLYLMCLVSAYDFGFITREDAVTRLRGTLNTIERLQHHESGFPYNYYDTTLAIRTSYFVSFVDSGWLVMGLYVAKNAFPEELGEQASRMLSRYNFSFFYDPVEKQMFHGYYDNLKVYSDYHYGAFYTEPRATSYLAIGKGDAPIEHWFRTYRTFPETYGWQQLSPINRVLKETLGVKYYGGYYEWNDLRYVPSWGGSLFEALMPTIVIKEKELAPDSLGLNDREHVLGHIKFAKEQGYPVWGMSPCAVPEGGYSEYGVAPLGSRGYKGGVVTPHVSFLALEFEPEEAIKNIRNLIANYNIYGEYGFYDAVNVKTGKVAVKYLCLDQGMIFVALNNYLNDGIIRKRFHNEPAIKNAEKLLTEEKLFEPRDTK